MNVSNCRYLILQLRERSDEVREQLAGGRIEDFAEYKRLCGVIHGLSLAVQLVEDLADKLEKED